MSFKSQQSGFTLLEVIIAITLLAFLSIYTADAIQKGLRSKTKIEQDLDRKTVVRDALRIMADDISKAFNYTDVHTILFNLAQKERQKREQEKKSKKPNDKGSGSSTSDPDAEKKEEEKQPEENSHGGTTPPKEFPLKEVKKWTHFIGTDQAINFTTVSNYPAYADAQISDQAEIGYSLRECRNRIQKKKKSQCLWRRKSNIINEDIEEGGKESVLIENVSELKFRYLPKGKEQDWLEKWNSKEGDEEQANTFPQAVEITLEIHDKSNKLSKPYKMTYVTSIKSPEGIKIEEDEKSAEEKAKSEGSTGE